MVKIFDCLENIAIPSILHQTNKNFEWIWLIDDKTPDDIKNRLVLLSEIYNATIIFDKWISPEGYGEGNSCGGDWVSKLQKKVKHNKLLVCTRYDVDDYISSDFVDIVQKYITDPRVCIDFKMRITIDEDKKLYLMRNTPPSPIVTLVEKTDRIKTPYCKPHYELSRDYKMKTLPNIVYAKTERKPDPSIIIKKLEGTILEIGDFEEIKKRI